MKAETVADTVLVEELPAYHEGVAASNSIYLTVTVPGIPESFDRAIQDFKAGRVVDLEEAHTHVPPFKLRD